MTAPISRPLPPVRVTAPRLSMIVSARLVSVTSGSGPRPGIGDGAGLKGSCPTTGSGSYLRAGSAMSLSIAGKDLLCSEGERARHRSVSSAHGKAPGICGRLSRRFASLGRETLLGLPGWRCRSSPNRPWRRSPGSTSAAPRMLRRSALFRRNAGRLDRVRRGGALHEIAGLCAGNGKTKRSGEEQQSGHSRLPSVHATKRKVADEPDATKSRFA